MKARGKLVRIFALALCLVMALTLVPGLEAEAAEEVSSGVTTGVKDHVADGSTMFSFRDYLDLTGNSRYAGRLWSDKTVLTDGSIDLTKEIDLTVDKNDPTFTNQGDFLHVFSLLGSSQDLEAANVRPLDVVFLLDMSGSMAMDVDCSGDTHHGTNDERIAHSRISKVLDSINSAIGQVLEIEGSRVAVVGYGATSRVILPLGNYEKPANGKYVTVGNFRAYGGGNFNYSGTASGAYTVSVNLKNKDTKEDVKNDIRNDYSSTNAAGATLIGYHTDLQAGIWVGFNELYNNMKETKDVTYTYENPLTGAEQTVARVPVAFVMTDGGSNYAMKAPSVSGSAGDEWHNLTVASTVSSYGGNQTKYRAESNASDKTGSGIEFGGGDAVILDILLTASYMKAKVEKKYESLLPEDLKNAANRPEFSVRTISVDTPDTVWQIPRVYATLDPAKHFKSTGGDYQAVGDTAPWDQNGDIISAYNYFDQWKNLTGNNAITINFKDSDGGESSTSTNRSISFRKLQADEVIAEGVTLTNQDVIDNINYSDGFSDVDTDALTGIFSDLVEEFSEPVFAPVQGGNDLGVNNAVTYMDPMGKYMEVKDVDSLVLFGQRHDLVQTGVYDYAFNRRTDIRENGKVTGGFVRGWYETSTGKHETTPTSSTNGEYYNMPSQFGSAEEARAAGWEFYFDRKTAQQFVPSLDLGTGEGESVEDIPEKQRNTTYTFYRFSEDLIGEANDGENLDAMHNPSYGYRTTSTGQKEWNRTFNLTDIRVWVEDTGTYNDDVAESGGLLTDAGYDQALWISIPTEAVPLRTVAISQQVGQDGQPVENTFSYTTNIVDQNAADYDALEKAQDYQDLPLRLIYSVGLSDDVKTEDGRLDLARISQSYLETHTVDLTPEQQDQVEHDNTDLSDGDVWFYSNWYNANKTYNGYVLDSSSDDPGLTYGEPVVSFSPSNDNRYYIFEKNLVLYSFESDDTTSHQPLMDSTTGRPAEFTPDSGYAAGNETLTYTHEGHAHTYKAVTDTSQISSDKWYYIVVEYFALDKQTGVGHRAYNAVGRKGSEFGSGVGSGELGAYLCWYRPSPTAADEGPNTQEYRPGVDPPTSVNDGGTWYLAAKAGGLRVGAMSQNVRLKDTTAGSYTWKDAKNNTGTSETYYLPTVSVTTGTSEETGGEGGEGGGETGGTRDTNSDNGVVINAYLGNNGMLWTSDTHLLVTKTVDRAGESGVINDDREFSYEIKLGETEGGTGVIPEDITVNAIIVTRSDNGAGNISWRRRLSYIDMPISSQGLLQDEDYNLVKVGINGNVMDPEATEGYYYLYVGDNETSGDTGDAHTFRLYNNFDLTGHPSITTADVTVTTNDDGTITYSLTKGWVVDPDFTAPEGLPALDSSTSYATLYKKEIGNFKVCTVDLSPDLDQPLTRQDTNITVEGTKLYAGLQGLTGVTANTRVPIEVAYATKTVEFKKGVGEFTLHDGEGLLFVGLDAETDYQVTELLSEQDVKDGYDLQFVDHVREGRYYRYDQVPDAEKPTARDYTYYFDLEKDKNNVWGGSTHHETNCKGEPDLSVTEPTAGRPDAWAKKSETDPDEKAWLRHYFWYNGEKIDTDFTPAANSGSKAAFDGTVDASGNVTSASYTVSGSTDSFEQRVHFFNLAPILEKVETDPGQDVGVAVGSDVHYDITWYNNAKDTNGAAMPAHVTVYDPLDDGVDFTSAALDPNRVFIPDDPDDPGDSGWNPDPDYKAILTADDADGVAQFGSGERQLLIGYTGREGENIQAIAEAMVDSGFPVSGNVTDRDAKVDQVKASLKNHTVVWSIHRAEAASAGVVELNVEVNDRAETYWNGYQSQSTTEVDPNYDPFDDLNTPNEGNEPNDYQILNRAGVRVENGSAQFTQIIENPVNKPSKNEVRIQDADTILPGTEPDLTVGEDLVKETLVTDGVWEGPEVDVGDAITYRVTWKNFNKDNLSTEDVVEGRANVTVIDQLDPGVDFNSTATVEKSHTDLEHETATVQVLKNATAYRLVKLEEGADTSAYTQIDGKYYEEIPLQLSKMVEQEISDPSGEGTIKQLVDTENWPPVAAASYNDHTITWDLGTQEPEAEGFVTFTVTVNENARKDWNYEGEYGADWPNGADDDDIIHNRASVTVQNADMVVTGTTDRIDNPLWTPEKTETEISGSDQVSVVPGGDGVLYGQQVGVGDTIAYRVTWKNIYKTGDNDPGFVVDGVTDITITDHMDPGLEYNEGSASVWKRMESHTGSADETHKQLDGVWYEKTSDEAVYTPAPAHTLTWALKSVQPQTEGFVEFTVTVTEDAVKNYAYDDEGGMGAPAEGADPDDYRIQNQAIVQVGNDTMLTEKMENPVSGKTETDPGADREVVVGQKVTYEIGWHNTAAAQTAGAETPDDSSDDEWEFKRAKVVIEDQLDPGVDFVSASYPYNASGAEITLTLDAKFKQSDGTYKVSNQNYVPTAEVRVAIEYNPTTRMVTWTLNDRDPNSQGRVHLTVQVNDYAWEHWDYYTKPYDGTGAAGGTTTTDPAQPNDDIIHNQAKVTIDNNPRVTNKVDNPLWEPEKIETEPGDGKMVQPGDTITFQVTWENTENVAANVTITDPLDPGVDFDLTTANVAAYVVDEAGETVPGSPDGALSREGESALKYSEMKPTYDWLVQGGDPTEQSSAVVYDDVSHALTWKFGSQPAGARGYIQFTVTVNEDALADDNTVKNQAGVQVGNLPEQLTNIVENPVPEKEETVPGADVGVRVGQQVDYTVHWANDATDPATGAFVPSTVTVTDVLDPGVDFVSASFGEGDNGAVLTHTEGEVSETAQSKAEIAAGGQPLVTITYTKNGDSQTVTWTLRERPAWNQEGSAGDVLLSVKVNEKAVENWKYEDPADGDDSFVRDADNDPDDIIHNRAKVEVTNGTTQWTDIIDNPVWEPEKTETDPGAGKMVGVGQTVTYEVTWKNYKEGPAAVVVTDALDIGVDFPLTADEDGFVGTAAAYLGSGNMNLGPVKALAATDYEEKTDPVTKATYWEFHEPGIYFDETNRTIVWALGAQASKAEGYVTFTVKVNDQARTYWNDYEPMTPAPTDPDFEILNQAAVQVGHDPQTKTNIVENPLVEKHETVPGEGVEVVVGEPITYEIHWVNDAVEETTGEPVEAKVTITDKLDPGVDFAQAIVKGLNLENSDVASIAEENVLRTSYTDPDTNVTLTIVYDRDTHMVTWTIDKAAPGESGVVTLVVTVNDLAKKDWQYGTGAGGADTNVPGEDDDFLVHNRARIQVENGSDVTTNIVDNPLEEFRKTEFKPDPSGVLVDYNGHSVGVGEELSFRLTWLNYKTTEATVTVTDPLDVGLTFTMDSAKAYIQTGVDAVSGEPVYEEMAVTGTYDPATHTITWELGKQDVGAKGYVEFKATVNDQAKVAWDYENFEPGQTPNPDAVDYRIYNKGTITVDNEPHMTNEVENPLPKKEETDPGDGESVVVGQQIDYAIEWFNDASVVDQDTGERTNVPSKVTVIDPLDDGVDFVSASFGVGEEATELTLTAEEAAADTVEKTVQSSAENTAGEPMVTITYKKTAEGQTVTWTLLERKAEATGNVELSVRVNENARMYWNEYEYEPDHGNVDDRVLNRAEVVVENGSRVFTDIPENPLYEPEKTEPTPGDGKLTGVGEVVTYNVTWKNYKSQVAEVTVTDKLDPGVDYNKDTAKAYLVAGDTETELTDGVYDPASHTITWSLGKQNAGAEGYVTFDVTVNDKATKEWDYGTGAGGTDTGDVGTGSDYKIVNQAHVKVGNDDAVTNKVENPVPEKTETDPGDGKTVGVGREITYNVHWVNDAVEKDASGNVTGYAKSTVTVTDKLDPGVDFVSASFGGVTLEAAADGSSVSKQSEKKVTVNGEEVPEITIAYDSAAHKVTWTLRDRDAQAQGDVTLLVRVNDQATLVWEYVEDDYGKNDGTAPGTDEDHLVRNKAHVEVANGSAVDTSELTNPLYEPEKTEPTPGDGKLTGVGEKITYRVTWKNYKDQEAEVTVTDKLDPGVDYNAGSAKAYRVAADGTRTELAAGVYDQASHTVTWTLGKQAAGAEGYVTFDVTVNDQAAKEWDYDTGAGTGNDYKIVNEAHVKVDNEDSVTNEVENPLEDKVETDPGEGKDVVEGQAITYEVRWVNDAVEMENGQPKLDAGGNTIPAASTVTITDKLDPGVDFAQASFGGVTLKAGQPEATGKDGLGEITIGYDAQKHMVTWVLKTRAPQGTEGSSGTVQLVVTVNEDARYDWHYSNGSYGAGATDPSDVDESTRDDMVYNRARIVVDNGSDVTTHVVENPVYQPEKTEIDPGAGKLVGVGEVITYRVTWKNYKDQEAEVTVTDKLDPGVDYNAGTAKAYLSDGTELSDGVYDGANHTITWDLGKQAADAEGYVTFDVTVNDKAAKEWSYGTGADGSDTNEVGSGSDHKVFNQAHVKVDNDDSVTDIVENPVPEKEETAPGEGEGVMVGDEIDYSIYWLNDSAEVDPTTKEVLKYIPGTVAVTDPLDPGVDFISASFGGVTQTGVGKTTEGDVTVEYDRSTHTVTWTLANRPALGEPGSEGTVTLKVRVNEDAPYKWDYDNKPLDPSTQDRRVVDQARVTTDRGTVRTNKVENPIWTPEKTEPDPGDGKLVNVGQKITYRVTWKNYHLPTETSDGVATVTVIDQLDPGVDYDAEKPTAKAYAKGGTEIKAEITYDEASHTLTWVMADQAPGTEGYVEFTVTVNEDAVQTWDYGSDHVGRPGSGEDHMVRNQASVEVDNDGRFWTDIVKNPLPEKKEVTPGADEQVDVGDEVRYSIHWTNDSAEIDESTGKLVQYIPGTVTVTDPLDPGVDFVMAGYEDVILVAGGDNTVTERDVTITYDEGTHTVTWTLADRPAMGDEGSEGTVDLRVRVNEKAETKWDYDADGNGQPGSGNDYEIHDQARVTTNRGTVKTEKVTNPTAKPVGVTLLGRKTLDGETPKAGRFTFTLTPYATKDPILKANDPVKGTITVKNDADGKITFFENLVYGHAGTYEYLVKEERTTQGGQTLMDTILYHVAVIVTEDENGDLLASIGVWNGTDFTIIAGPAKDNVVNDVAPLLFENATVGDDEAVVVIEGIKEMIGGVLKDGQFSFTLSAAGWNKGTATVTSEADDPATEAPGNGGPSEGEENTEPGSGDDKEEVPDGGSEEEKSEGETGKETEGTGGNNTSEPEVTKPETTKPETSKPELSKPEPSKSESSGNEPEPAAQSQTVSSETAEARIRTSDLNVNMRLPMFTLAQMLHVVRSEGEVSEPAPTASPAPAQEDKPAPAATPEPDPEPDEEPAEPTATPESSPEAEPTATPESSPEAEPTATPESSPEAEPTATPESSPEAEPTATPEAGAEAEATAEPEATEEPNGTNEMVTVVDMGQNDQPMPGGKFGGTATTWNVSDVFRFQAIKFTEPGTYYYQLTEVDGGQGGTAYDQTVYWIIVTVTEENGKMHAEVEYRTGDDPVSGPVFGSDEPEFTNATDAKTETDPGAGMEVEVGDVITYDITWVNDKPEGTGTVTVRDPLDENVAFESASFGGVTLTAENADGKVSSGDVTITYDKAEHTVYWVLANRPNGSHGNVELKVKVLPGALHPGLVQNQAFIHVDNNPEHETEIVENPLKTGRLNIRKIVKGSGDKTKEFTFTVTLTDPDGKPLEGEFEYGGSKSGTIKNGGTITLRHDQDVTIYKLPAGTLYTVTESDNEGYDVTIKGDKGVIAADSTVYAVFTNSKDTPDGEPHKVETDPGDGKPVMVGQNITYEISWTNYEAEAADVVIRDPLDKNVQFVSASFGGKTLNSDGTVTGAGTGVTILYDANSHTVLWTLRGRPAGSTGKVTLVVKVTEAAMIPGEVQNQAFVRVGDNPEQATEIPKNPLEEPTPTPKPSPTPGPIPKTGDANRVGLWLAVLGLALTGLGGTAAAIGARRKKRGK